MRNTALLFATFMSMTALIQTACKNETTSQNGSNTVTEKTETPKKELRKQTLEEMMAKPEVPVLCYHHIREFDTRKPQRMKEYEVTPAGFAEQLKALHDNGYHSILPDQLYNYLTMGDTLPSKPFMLTYDDTDEEQFSIAKVEMDKYGYKGVYFMMTIPINRPNYMNKTQIRQLAYEGHTVACHTWDHHKVTAYTGEDWDKQFSKSKTDLEAIAGKPVEYFAYPFGLWNHDAVVELQKRNYKLAFILSTKRDPNDFLHTIRRTIIPGTWSPEGMLKAMKTTFHLKD
jgi:peptidoglycan/xylan/chitin deacetylase (PgdA/CDA1 family)